MVEPAQSIGEVSCVGGSIVVEKSTKNTTRKRKLDVSPNIRRRLKKFEKENPTDSPVKSYFKQFQYESEEEKMPRSRQASSMERPKDGMNDKELLNEKGDEKGLEERLRESQNQFMIEIKETLNVNISQSVKDAISAVMPGV